MGEHYHVATRCCLVCQGRFNLEIILPMRYFFVDTGCFMHLMECFSELNIDNCVCWEAADRLNHRNFAYDQNHLLTHELILPCTDEFLSVWSFSALKYELYHFKAVRWIRIICNFSTTLSCISSINLVTGDPNLEDLLQ